MAKRQRTMKDMFSRSTNLIGEAIEVSTHTSNTSSCEQQVSRIEMARLAWKESWYVNFSGYSSIQIRVELFVNYVKINKLKMFL